MPLRLLLTVAALFGGFLLAAQDDLFGGGDDDFALDEPGSIVLDYDQLKWSHLTELDTWPGVKPPRPEEGDTGPWIWEAVDEPGYNHLQSFTSRLRRSVRPLGDQPLTTRLAIPEAGTYRVWLCYLATPGKRQPIDLTLGAETLAYHEQPLSGNASAGEQEKRRPIHVETEMQRIAPPRQPMFIWEYRDVKLAAGPLDVAVKTADRELRIDALFLTRSKDFRPSKAVQHDANTLGQSYLRFRVAQADEAGEISFSNDLTYHSPHFEFGSEVRNWYWSLERELGRSSVFAGEADKPLAKGEWSRWLHVSGALLSGGNFVTTKIGVNGARGQMVLEVQYAWFPHDGAVLKTKEIPVAEGYQRGLLLTPLYHPRVPLPVATPEQPAWGMRSESYLAGLRNTVDVARDHQAVVASLKLPDEPLATRLVLNTSAGVDPAAANDVAAMLRGMGFTHVFGVPRQTLRDHGMRVETNTHHNDLLFHTGTHCPSDPLARGNLERYFAGVAANILKQGWQREEVVLSKFGDEIGAIVSAGHINDCRDCRARFHAYLDRHYGGPESFGETSHAALRVTLDPTGDGVFERRLVYASNRFMADFTAEFYALATEVIGREFPNVRTYCNFSPHPVIFGGTMNHSDWFNLTRRGGATMAWGEDWASMHSWGFYMGWQIVSYYAALVECAARGSDGHGGFYAVWGTGRQQFSCVAAGLRTVRIYTYGPEYALADAANAWSERTGKYQGIATGLRALGPADPFIDNEHREPALVGLLYNRDHEIWHPELGRLYQADRAATFVALQQANLPTAIVLAEDLLAGEKLPFRAIYLSGFNLDDDAIAALERYVQAGGIVVATGGAGLYDRFDTGSAKAAAFLGVRQRLVGTSNGGPAPDQLESHQPIDRVALDLPGNARDWPVIGLKFALEPISGVDLDVLGRFADGSPAVVRRRLGKGAVWTWGINPGAIFRAISPMKDDEGKLTYRNYQRADALAIGAPADLAPDARGHLYDHHLVETRRFDHPDGTALLLNNFAYQPIEARQLRIRWPADRPLATVRGVFAGPLTFTRDGDWVTAQLPITEEVEVVLISRQ